MLDDHAYSEPWPSQNNLFKYFQGYLGIFMNIDAYSTTLTGVQLGGMGGLLKSKKSPLIWERKTLIVFISGFNLSFKI